MKDLFMFTVACLDLTLIAAIMILIVAAVVIKIFNWKP